MKIVNQSFPHPVLGIQDDVAGKFEPVFNWSCDRAYFYLYPIYNLQNDTLSKLIQEKKATYVMEVECRNTFYNESFYSSETSPVHKIRADALRDNVKVSFVVCASEPINNYQIEGAHSDYLGHTFDIENGDILAYGGETSFLAEKNYDSLKAVSSIMFIKKGDYKQGYAKVNYNNDKIILELSQENYLHYSQFKNDDHYREIFHTSLVLPILYKALKFIKDEEDDLSEQKWFQIIKTRIEDESLEIDDEEAHYLTIQKLFGNPYTRLFESINKLNEVLYNNA